MPQYQWRVARKRAIIFFGFHQINGAFVNNDDLDLIRLQLSRGSIYQSPGRTTGPVETVVCRVETQLGAVLVHSIQQRKQNRLFHIYILFSVARAGQGR